jgi:hypothetical protein
MTLVAKALIPAFYGSRHAGLVRIRALARSVSSLD